MPVGHPIQLHGSPVAGGKFPLICVPLVGRTRADILAELEAVLAEKPDVLEWRVDYFAGIAKTDQVIDVVCAIRAVAGSLPVMFTCRSHCEGGQNTTLWDGDVVSLCEAVCHSRQIDLIDFELRCGPLPISRVRMAAHANGIQLVLSCHDFATTPDTPTLVRYFDQARVQGADVAKLAVMSHSPADTLRLLDATLQASQTLDIPLISVAMGPHGAVTRLMGGEFGSALSFAVGVKASAPGQMPVQDIRAVQAILQRSQAGPTDPW